MTQCVLPRVAEAMNLSRISFAKRKRADADDVPSYSYTSKKLSIDVGAEEHGYLRMEDRWGVPPESSDSSDTMCSKAIVQRVLDVLIEKMDFAGSRSSSSSEGCPSEESNNRRPAKRKRRDFHPYGNYAKKIRGAFQLNY